MNPKYYYYSKREKRWLVKRQINGQAILFGQYPTEREAKLAVELLHKYGWDRSNSWKVRAEVKEMVSNEG